jgi:hypothetical protein
MGEFEGASPLSLRIFLKRSEKMWSKSTCIDRWEVLSDARKMGFAIFRMQKLKSAVGVVRSLKHAFREQDTPNADPALKSTNTHIRAKTASEALGRFNELIPSKVRKNAVYALEFMFTASPEVMAGLTKHQQDQYFKKGLQWLQKRFGAENLFYAGVHRDETTPHCYAYVVPLKDGKLNARHYVGGTKHVLSDMQTDFAEDVGKEFGFERGLKGSKAKHQSIRKWYSKLQEVENKEFEIYAQLYQSAHIARSKSLDMAGFTQEDSLEDRARNFKELHSARRLKEFHEYHGKLPDLPQVARPTVLKTKGVEPLKQKLARKAVQSTEPKKENYPKR